MASSIKTIGNCGDIKAHVSNHNIKWPTFNHSDMRNIIRDTYFNYYKTDPVHSIRHCDDVFNNMIAINSTNGYLIPYHIICIAAYTHDMFSGKDRENHHKLASDYILHCNDVILSRLNKTDRKRIAKMVLNHRASTKIRKNTSTDIVCIRIADKGYPNLEAIIRRASTDSSIDPEKFLIHIKEKYGDNGYAYVNDPLWTEYYKDDVEKCKSQVETLTVDNLKESLEYYKLYPYHRNNKKEDKQ